MSYYARRTDPRMERRELSRRLARYEDYDRRLRGEGCDCGCGGCDGERQVSGVQARASFCTGSVCVEERSGRRWIKGTAHRYGVWSSSICGDTSECFREIIEVGAFRPALSRPDVDVAVTVDHEPGLTLARYEGRDGDTARVWEDRVGLHFEFRVPDTALGRRTLSWVQTGRLRGASFVMAEVESEWTEADDGELLRRVIRVLELRDVAVVQSPAYSFGPPEPSTAVA